MTTPMSTTAGAADVRSILTNAVGHALFSLDGRTVGPPPTFTISVEDDELELVGLVVERVLDHLAGMIESPEYLRRMREAHAVLADLDRCVHGRHEGDDCSGCAGPSKGNPFMVQEPGHVLHVYDVRGSAGFPRPHPLEYRQIGFDLAGRPITVPTRGEAWRENEVPRARHFLVVERYDGLPLVTVEHPDGCACLSYEPGARKVRNAPTPRYGRFPILLVGRDGVLTLDDPVETVPA